MANEQNNQFQCPNCAGVDFDALVQYGSYMLRCKACGEVAVATSWIAIGPKWKQRVLVYRDGHEDAGPVLIGMGCDLVEAIDRLASDGTTMLLRGA